MHVPTIACCFGKNMRKMTSVMFVEHHGGLSILKRIATPRNPEKLTNFPPKSQNQAHRYILFNYDEVQDYIREHEDVVHNNRKRSRWSKAKNQREDFIQWFEARVIDEDVSDLIRVLSRGPNNVVKSFSGYVINGYRFHTRKRDARRKTQNSGVTLEALTRSFKSAKDENPEKICLSYYGAITNIIELDYYGHFKHMLFKCDWFDAEEDKYGLTCVYFNKKMLQG